MKTKKILFIVSLFYVGSLIAQPGGFPGGPGDIGGGTNVSDVPAAIDRQIWLGLIGGLAIGIYFLLRGEGNTVVESKSGFSCPKCNAVCSDYTFMTQTEAVFKEVPDPHYSWDETHKCTNCDTLYFLHNGT
jgi:hypothetical protein